MRRLGASLIVVLVTLLVILSLAARTSILLIAILTVVIAALLAVAVRQAVRSRTRWLFVAVCLIALFAGAVYWLAFRSDVSWAGPPPLRNTVLAVLVIALGVTLLLVGSRRWYPKWWTRGVLAIAASGSIAVITANALKTSFMFLGPPPELFVSRYVGRLVHDNDRPGRFSLVEELEFDRDWSGRYLPDDRPPRLTRKPREIISTSKGLILKEVVFRLPETDSSGFAVKRGPDAHGQEFSLTYLGACEVDVTGLASGAFVAADNATSVDRNAYLGSETVAWALSEPSAGVRFAYIVPPFQPLQPIVSRMSSLSTIGAWFVALLMVVGSAIVVGLLKPALLDYAKARIDQMIARKEPASRTGPWRRRRRR